MPKSEKLVGECRDPGDRNNPSSPVRYWFLMLARLVATLEEQFTKSAELERTIWAN